MDLIKRLFTSSVGKKMLMALTGLCMTLFLAVHLAGNMTIYAGAGAFNGYAAALHSLDSVLILFNVGLLAVALVHVGLGVLLYIQNRRARPTGYLRYKNPGGRTIGSDSMPYTGLLILGFTVYHLLKFTFVDKTDTTIFDIVSIAFASPATVLVYCAAMIAVALHISHGVWSLFQTLGANSEPVMVLIYRFSRLAAVAFGLGFGAVPVYLYLAG